MIFTSQMLQQKDILHILASIATILVCIYLHQLWKKLNYWKDKNVPYAKPIVIFGNFARVAFRKLHLNEQVIALYNLYKDQPYVGIFIFTRPYLMIRDPKLIKKVMVKDFNVFCDRGISIDETIDPIASNNLFVAKGEIWRAIRQKLSPAFSSGRMRLMFPLIENCCKNLITALGSRSGQTVDVKEFASRYTVDVISVCAFGFEANSLCDDKSVIGMMAHNLSDPNSLERNFAMMCLFFLPAVASLLKLTVGDKNAVEFFSNLFKKMMDKRKNEDIVKNDFIDLLIKLQKAESTQELYKLDDIRMAGQAISFFFAGNDTTSTILSFLINEISMKTEIQEEMRLEIEDAEKQHGRISYDNLQHLKYMDKVIKETLRKYPVSPMLFRKTNCQYTFEETGLTLEKDTHVVIPVAGIHNDPSYYNDPDEFNPERFSDDSNDLVPYTFLSFGDGPRVCIGERFAMTAMKAALFHLLQKLEFTRCETSQYPIEINRVTPFLQPKKGVPLKVLSRKTVV